MNTKYLKLGFVIFLLLLYVRSIAQSGKGNISTKNGTFTNSTLNTGTINYNSIRNVFQLDRESISNIKKIPEINKTIATLSSKVDTVNYQLSILLSMLEFNNKSKDSIIIAQNVLIEKLILDRESYLHLADSAISLLKDRQKEIEREKWKYLPLGIHQFVTNQTGKGILFTGTQVGLSVGGVLLFKRYKKTYDAYLCEPYQSKSRHNNLENSYKWQLSGAITCFTGAAASLIWNYYDNFKKEDNKNVSFTPTVILDWKGKPQVEMNLSINF